jgi:hypothetical protein
MRIFLIKIALFSKKSLFQLFKFFSEILITVRTIRNKVKMTADSEFLVHFYVGPHFKGF